MQAEPKTYLYVCQGSARGKGPLIKCRIGVESLSKFITILASPKSPVRDEVKLIIEQTTDSYLEKEKANKYLRVEVGVLYKWKNPAAVLTVL